MPNNRATDAEFAQKNPKRGIALTKDYRRGVLLQSEPLRGLKVLQIYYFAYLLQGFSKSNHHKNKKIKFFEQKDIC